MLRVIRQWVDLNDWTTITKMMDSGWEMAEETADSVLLIKEV